MKLFAIISTLWTSYLFRPPVQNQKFPSIDADVPLQPKVTTSFEMIFHFRFVVCNYPLPCAPRKEGDSGHGYALPFTHLKFLQGGSDIKSQQYKSLCELEEAGFRGTGWQKTCWHGKTGKCSHASKHTQTLKVHPMIHPCDLGVSEGFLLLLYLLFIGKCKLCLMHFFRSNTASLCINSS